MPLATVDSLVEALRGRAILNPQQLDTLSREHAPAHGDTQELAKTLIRLKWLSVYQAKKLLADKADELQVGQYVILDKVGEGGMGKVYKAVQLSLHRTVALKVVRAALLKSEVALKRFQREVRAAGKLNHPNIVRVFDADQIGDRHFLAMELIEGSDLAKLVKTRGPLPIAVACSFIRQAALGLQYAHEQGMVHRDIKPSNLLVAMDEKGQYGAKCAVKILDMGLARTLQGDVANDDVSTELTRTGTVIGTPDFMSPEQAKNSSTVDHRSDLYSLGCTFFFLLTGEVPFPNGNPLEKLLQHQMDPPRPIQLIRLDTPPEVATIVQCLLAKKPDDRFQSGAALANALERWTSGSASVKLAAGSPLPAEAVDPHSASVETVPQDPFDFDVGTDRATPEMGHRPATIRRPPPLPRPPEKKRPFSMILALSAVFAVFLCVGAVTAAIIMSSRKKEEPPTTPGSPDQPKGDPGKALAPKPKVDPPPAKDMEVMEKFMPDDASMVAMFDVKQWQASSLVKPLVVDPLARQLAGFRRATTVDLLSAVERVVVGFTTKEETVIVLQGHSLVIPRLLDGVRALPNVTVEPAWNGGPDLALLAGGGQEGGICAAAAETSIIMCAQRERVVEALQKRDGSKRTRFTDPTIARAIDFAYQRPFGVFLAMGLRQDWSKAIPAANKLTLAAAGLQFDERGMHLHVIGDELEPGKLVQFQKAFARILGEQVTSSESPKLTVQRIANLLLEAEPSRGFWSKSRFVHLQATIPAERLEEWFAPFISKGDS